jgi:6,7-dimethyl-8-ribityllumazine synthase
MSEIIGRASGLGRRFAIVASRFNENVTRKLVDGAFEAFLKHEVEFESVDVVWVPGAWELPTAARWLMDSDRYNAVVAVGAVIRGDTPHFDYVAASAAEGLARASSDYDVPIGFGLLTCDTLEQAEARAGGDRGNKGWDAAMAALEMADLAQFLDHEDVDEN